MVEVPNLQTMAKQGAGNECVAFRLLPGWLPGAREGNGAKKSTVQLPLVQVPRKEREIVIHAFAAAKRLPALSLRPTQPAVRAHDHSLPLGPSLPTTRVSNGLKSPCFAVEKKISVMTH